MSVKFAFSSALILALLSIAPVRAQFPTLPGKDEEVIPPPSVVDPAPPGPLLNQPQPGETPVLLPPVGLSNWMTYHRPVGPMGNGTPMATELFLRSGLTVPTSATTFGRTLSPGWEIQGGGRLLLFNQAEDRAWTIEGGLSNNVNQGQHSDISFPLSVLVPNNLGGASPFTFGAHGKPGVTVRSLNQTFVNLGVGREWYLLGTAVSPGRRWRVGFDGGGRWGTSKIQVHEFHHRTDTLGGVYTSLHTDFEVPVGAYTFIGGLRGEVDYTWSDILQRPCDILGVNALANFGVRF